MKHYYVGVDMDGVLYPFDTAFNKLSKKYGGPTHDFKAWVDFSKTYGDDIVDKVWHDPTLFNSEPPYPKAIEGLKALYDIPGVKPLIITNPGRNPELSITAKWHWLQKYAPFVHHYDFITMHPKWLMNLDMIIEDNHDNVLSCLKAHPDTSVYQAVLVSRPWNEKYQTKLMRRGAYVVEGIEQVPSLLGLLTRFKEVSNG